MSVAAYKKGAYHCEEHARFKDFFFLSNSDDRLAFSSFIALFISSFDSII